jgi:hypothetical protein
MAIKKSDLLTMHQAGRSESFSGIILDSNSDWIYIQRVFDYRIDGYTVLRNKKITFSSSYYEKQAMKIIEKKGLSFANGPRLPLDSLDSILNFITNNYLLIQIDSKKGDSSDVVKFLKKEKDKYVFKELTVKAKWRYTLRLPEKELEFISFDNDYLNSLKLLL